METMSADSAVDIALTDLWVGPGGGEGFTLDALLAERVATDRADLDSSMLVCFLARHFCVLAQAFHERKEWTRRSREITPLVFFSQQSQRLLGRNETKMLKKKW